MPPLQGDAIALAAGCQPRTCASGCCGPTGCLPGTSASACGFGGQSCTDCMASRARLRCSHGGRERRRLRIDRRWDDGRRRCRVRAGELHGVLRRDRLRCRDDSRELRFPWPGVPAVHCRERDVRRTGGGWGMRRDRRGLQPKQLFWVLRLERHLPGSSFDRRMRRGRRQLPVLPPRAGMRQRPVPDDGWVRSGQLPRLLPSKYLRRGDGLLRVRNCGWRVQPMLERRGLSGAGREDRWPMR
jgi:hypothetical protein